MLAAARFIRGWAVQLVVGEAGERQGTGMPLSFSSLPSLFPLSHWYTGPLHLDSHESHPWSLHTLAALGWSVIIPWRASPIGHRLPTTERRRALIAMEQMEKQTTTKALENGGGSSGAAKREQV